jgi:TRAP-type C4-dicarboxylate transport system permease small subunit
MASNNWILPVEDKILSIDKYLSYIAAVFGALIMIIATVDVITAKIFSVSVPSGKQLIEEFNVIIVFLAIPYVAIERGHINITLFDRWMSHKFARIVKLFGHTLGALVSGFCTWRSWILVADSFAQHSYKYGAIDFPLWPFQLVVLLGFALLTISFIVLFIKELVISQKIPPSSEPQ